MLRLVGLVKNDRAASKGLTAVHGELLTDQKRSLHYYFLFVVLDDSDTKSEYFVIMQKSHITYIAVHINNVVWPKYAL